LKILSDFISLVFPDVCLICEDTLFKGETYFCTDCIRALPKTDYHLEADNPVKAKFDGLTNIKYGFSYLKFVKRGRVQKILHRLKYDEKEGVGVLLGRWYGHELKQAGYDKEFDKIIPVPLHKEKLRKRGYNQAERFAIGISSTLGIPCDAQSLVRTEERSSQTLKSRINRWRNMEFAFRVNSPVQVENKKVLLVDDVITTGATLEACAKTIQESRCKEVSVAAIASV